MSDTPTKLPPPEQPRRATTTDQLRALLSAMHVDEADESARCTCTLSAPTPQPKLSHDDFVRMLRGDFPPPWDAQFFLDFAESEHNAESLRFFMEVEGVKRAAGDASAVDPDSVFLITPANTHGSVPAWETAIVEQFVRPQAPFEINVSSSMRDDCLTKASTGDLSPPAVFGDCQTEIVNVMTTDSFPRFAKRVLTQNLTEAYARRRYAYAALTFALTVAGVGLCLGFYVPRWYLLLFFLPWLWGVHHLMSARTRLCALSALWGESYIGVTSKVIACPITKRTNRARAKVLAARAAVVAALLTLAGLVLTWIIEAANGGKILYGPG